ncbi:hypothetical protein ACWCV5_35810 [Streptomyces tubercidicus]
MHNRLLDARALLDEAAARAPSTATDTLTSEARSLVEECNREVARVEQLEAQVYIEGPWSVTNAVVEMSQAGHEFKKAVAACLRRLTASDGCPRSVVDVMAEKRDAAYYAYVGFLFAASGALDGDGLETPAASELRTSRGRQGGAPL